MKESWETSIVIARPIEEVFAFVVNTDKGPLWHVGSDAIQALTPGPIGVGTRYRNIKQLLFWQLETITEISEYELDQEIAFKSISGPYSLEIRYLFERTEQGTHLSELGITTLKGFWGLAARLFVGTAEKNSKAGLRKLKQLLEAQARSTSPL